EGKAIVETVGMERELLARLVARLGDLAKQLVGIARDLALLVGIERLDRRERLLRGCLRRGNIEQAFVGASERQMRRCEIGLELRRVEQMILRAAEIVDAQ